MYENEKSIAERAATTEVTDMPTDNASNHILAKDKNNVNSNKGEYGLYSIRYA